MAAPIVLVLHLVVAPANMAAPVLHLVANMGTACLLERAAWTLISALVLDPLLMTREATTEPG